MSMKIKDIKKTKLPIRWERMGSLSRYFEINAYQLRYGTQELIKEVF